MSIQRAKEAAASQMLVVEHVFKTVPAASGELEILRDIDFALPAGSTTAIVGASGSGKSTLLSIMAGLDVPSSGTVRVASTDLFALDVRAQRCAGRRWALCFRIFSCCPTSPRWKT